MDDPQVLPSQRDPRFANDRASQLYIEWLDDDTPSIAYCPLKVFPNATSPFSQANCFVSKIQLASQLIQFGFD